MEVVVGWHILPNNCVLRDGRKADLTGAWQLMAGDEPPKMCKRGMHASRRLIDALQYAQGALICRVEVRGDIAEEDDKLTGCERRVFDWINGTKLLHQFAIRCAARALRIYGVTDKRLWNTLRVKGRWVRGSATDQDLHTARAKAWGAPDTAARAAARDAAWDVAWAAAWNAARAEAWAEAAAAARYSAWTTTQDAAARYSVWTATRDAAWKEQNAYLEARVLRAMERNAKWTRS